MKVILQIIILFIFTSFINLQAQVMMDENFDYPAGDSLGAHGWVWFSGTTNTLMVVSPGLTYTGYPLSGIGNCTRVRNNGNDNYKQFPGDSAGNVYCAFMVRVDSVQAGGDYFFAFLPNNSTTNYVARIYAKDSSGSVAFGLSKSTSSSGTIHYTGPNYQRNVTYLFVVKYTFLTGSGTDDEMRLYIFTSGVPNTEPSVPTLGPATGTVNDAPNISRIALRQGSTSTSPTLNIDGFRVFKQWTNIVSVQTISTVANEFSLKQNYPNPFNPVTEIEFSLPRSSFVSLQIFDALGREVRKLLNENISQGSHKVLFNASGLSSGVYFYRITALTIGAETYTSSKLMILTK
jgi:hypothetical protein